MKLTALIVLAAFLSFAPASTARQTGSSAVIAVDRIDAIVGEQIAAQSIVGISVAIARDGEIVCQRHFGFEDREQQIAASDGTMYRWASISKPVTAVAAMQLVEQGRLDLDADVRTLVPEFPQKPWTITTRQLMCHQGGIVHYENGKVVREDPPAGAEHPYADVVVALGTFKASDLVNEPGTKYSYTTHGYMLVGAVVQRAGQAPFWDQVRERIATPAAMSTFRPDYQWEHIDHRAKGYKKIAGATVPSTDTDVSWKLAGGGFISTVGDLSRFSIALMDGTLVKPETFARMRQRQTLRDGNLTGYGLGLSIDETRAGATCGHSGSQEKTATYLLMAPESRSSVAVMCNTEGAELAALAKNLLKEIAGAVPAKTDEPAKTDRP